MAVSPTVVEVLLSQKDNENWSLKRTIEEAYLLGYIDGKKDGYENALLNVSSADNLNYEMRLL